MKRHNTLQLLGLLIATVLSACENDIDMNLESTEGILCVNAILKAGTSPNEIHVSKTTKDNIRNYGYTTVVSNATVTLTLNGSVVETSSHAADDYDAESGTYRLGTVLSPGDHVAVDVACEGQTAHYEGTVPERVENLSISEVRLATNYIAKGKENNSNEKCTMLVSVSFDDKGGDRFYTMDIGETDSIRSNIVRGVYYDYSWRTLSFLYWDEVGKSHKMYYDSIANSYDYDINGQRPLADEEVRSQGDNDLFLMDIANVYKTFRNSTFRGQKCDMTVYYETRLPSVYYAPANAPADIAPFYYCDQTVTITSIDEDYYYYIKVLNNKGSNSFEDFSELSGATKIPSNISGGTGNIFLTSSSTATARALDGWRPAMKESEEEFPIWDYYPTY